MLFALQDLFCEVIKEDVNDQGLAPGFRFHPTDGELITFYLASKVYNSSHVTGTTSIIGEVDLNRCEPWDVPQVAKMMGEKEWYFFSLRDRKYPTGLRTNRATRAGYWKATGKDRHVYNNNGVVVGMKKTLVFYMGRAPRGQKTNWVMHEYRLDDGHFSYRHACKEEWVICRLYHKNNSGEKRSYSYNNAYFNVAAAKETVKSGEGGGLEEEEDNFDDDDEEESSRIITQNPFSFPQQDDDSGDLKSLITPFIQAPERVATTDTIDKKTCPQSHSRLQSIINLSQAAIPKPQHNANQLINYPPWITTNARPLMFYDNNMDIISNPPQIRIHGESWPFVI